jgi:hypothetical protein
MEETKVSEQTVITEVVDMDIDDHRDCQSV